MQYDTSTKFSSLTIFFHWVVGLTIIGLLASGVYMSEAGVYALYPWHKAIGFILLFFALARVLWRMKNGWPTPLGDYSGFQHGIASVVHWVLIISTVLMPVSGLVGSVIGGHGLSVFGLEIFAPNFSLDDPEKTLPINYELSKAGAAVHHYLGYILIASVVLHVLGAYKHHIIDKDGTLKRMLGKRI